MVKVNDTRIYKNKYYPWYYTAEMDINLVPISYYTREQAEITLKGQFGNTVLSELYIIKGSEATRRGMVLGKNTFWWEGRRYQVKKYLYPASHSYNRARRRKYAKKIHQFIKSTSGRSGRKQLLNYFFYKTYGIKFK